MSLPSFVELMASLGLQDTPAVPRRTRHHRNVSSSSQSTSSSRALTLPSPWSSDPAVQTVVCPQPDASVPATADSLHSSASTLSYSSQSSFLSSNVAPSPAIVVSDASPVHHHPTWDPQRERERERTLSNGSNGSTASKKSSRYAPYKTETRDIFARRGSLPGTATEMSDILHDQQQQQPHSPSPVPSSHPPSNQVSPVRPHFATAQPSAAAPQPPQPLSVQAGSSLRQPQARISRRSRAPRAHNHVRTASNPLIGAVRPRARPGPASVHASSMFLDPDMANTAPVASISSLLLRKSDHPTFALLQTGAPVSAPSSAPSSAHPHVTTFALASSMSIAPNPQSTNGLADSPQQQQQQQQQQQRPQSHSPPKYLPSSSWPEGHTRSFSQRPRRMGARSEPPAPLTIPTLPSSFIIPPIPSIPPLPHTASGSGTGSTTTSGGGGGRYISRREFHSPDGPRRFNAPVGWRSRRASPPVPPASIEVAMES